MCLDHMNNLIFFHLLLSYLHKSKRINYTSYHHYPPCHQEGCEQPKREHTTPANLRPCTPRSRWHLPHPLLGLHYVQTRAPLDRSFSSGK
jgi:hypothetical protein